jgi:hypothetical protein
LILSKVISKSRIQSLIGKYQFNNQEIQKEINAVIEKDTFINSEITQLQNSDCDCEMDTTAIWHFPVLCTILAGLLFIGICLYWIGWGGWYGDLKPIALIGLDLMEFAAYSALILHCSFYYPYNL